MAVALVLPRKGDAQQVPLEMSLRAPGRVFLSAFWSLAGLTAIPAVVFVALYSALPHKELRFIMPAFSALTAPVAVWLHFVCRVMFAQRRADADAGRGAASLSRNFVAQRMGFVFLLFSSLVLSFAVGHIMTMANALTYPGAEAIDKVNARLLSDYAAASGVFHRRVFIDAYAGMTGVSRFWKLRPIVGAVGGHRSASADREPQIVYVKDPTVFNRTAITLATDRHNLAAVAATAVAARALDYLIVRFEDARWLTGVCNSDLSLNVDGKAVDSRTAKGKQGSNAASGNHSPRSRKCEIVDTIHQFERIDWRRAEIVTSPFLAVIRVL
jgi:hypothetical protein